MLIGYSYNKQNDIDNEDGGKGIWSDSLCSGSAKLTDLFLALFLN